MKQAPLRHRVEYAAYLLLKGVLYSLPHAAARAIGSAIGRLAHRLDGRHRAVARRNLALAFPELPRAGHRRLAAACFRHFGAALCDFISAGRLDPVELCRRFTYEGWEHLDAAEHLGKGTLLLGAHLGNWEISGRPIGLYRGTLHTVARPADNPYLERELSLLRQRFGFAIIHKRGAARRMLQVLRAGSRVGILPDQRVRPQEGILVPFFGRPALTTPVLARLSQHTGAPVVPVFAYPEPGGRYRLVVRAPMFPPDPESEPPASQPGEGAANLDPADPADPIIALTRRYLEVIEREIRAHPEMWLWMHRRWDLPGGS